MFYGIQNKKKGLKNIKDILISKSTERHKNFIELHETFVGKKMSAALVKAIAEGLQVVKHIIQSTLRSDTITDSFSTCGQFDRKGRGCDVEKILGQCKAAFTTDEITRVWEHMPFLCNQMKTNRELSMKDLGRLDMDNMSRANGRCIDDLVLNRRRFVFVTNCAFIASEDDKKLAKEALETEKVAKAVKRKADAELKKQNPKPNKRAKKAGVVAVEDI